MTVWNGSTDYEPTDAMIEAGLYTNHRNNSEANMVASFKAMMQQAEIDGLVSVTAEALSRPSRMAASSDHIADAGKMVAASSEGWVLVPAEATVEMMNAAVDRTGAGSGMSWVNRSPQRMFETAFRAMLAARPDAGREVEQDAVGAAEREVGRYVYMRVEALMSSDEGTAGSRELDYLAQIVSDVEEYGADLMEPGDLQPMPHFEASTQPVAVPVSEEIAEVLKPFAEVADWYDESEDDRFEVWMDYPQGFINRTVAQLMNYRRARRLLATLAGLAVPDKGVQGDQGDSRGPGNDQCGSQPEADVGATAALAKALEGFDDDYMTSETHHPGYVLIPTAKFEEIQTALKTGGSEDVA